MHGRSPMILSGLLLAAMACSGVESNATGPDVTDLTASAYRVPAGAVLHVSPERATVNVGATTKLSTTIRTSSGQTINGLAPLAVTWVSSDTTIARVSASGAVVGVKPGVTTVRAVGGEASGQSTITVAAQTTATQTTSTQPTSTQTTSTQTAAPTQPSTAPSTVTTAPTTQTQTNFQGALFYDDFTTYKTRQDFLARVGNNIGGTASWANALYNDGTNVNLASIDANVTYRGHPTMRYDQPAGVGSTPQLTAYFPNGQKLTHFWFRAKIRFSPGWTTVGTIPNCANAYKLFDWVWTPGVNGRGGVAITNTTEYQVYFYVLQNGSLVTPENLQVLGHTTTEWTSGQWWDYIIEFNETSPTTAVTKVWMAPDGQTPVLVGTDNGSTGSGGAWPSVAAVNLGANFNQNRVNAQALWYGEWSVYDGSKYSNPYNVH